jgi:pimeloyl-ACP methyl ester carboxylesterase
MTTVDADGVTLGVEHFGDAAAPLVLLAGGTTMLSWPDTLCEALARGGRHVVRYDLRDSGASTTDAPEAPAYTLRDLAADAAALARELDTGRRTWRASAWAGWSPRSLSAMAKRSPARSPVRGCSCWKRPRRRFPMRPPLGCQRTAASRT